MEGKRKADYMAVAVPTKKSRHELVAHSGEKGTVIQSVSFEGMVEAVLFFIYM